MNPRDLRLCRVLINAFLNVNPELITREQFWLVRAAHQAIQDMRYPLFLLSLGEATQNQQHKMITQLVEKLNLDAAYERLIALLIKKHDIMLLSQLLQVAQWILQERTDSLFFEVESVGSLDKEQQRTIEAFLGALSSRHILAEYRQNGSLVAGLRALNYTLLWEYSVARNMRAARTILR